MQIRVTPSGQGHYRVAIDGPSGASTHYVKLPAQLPRALGIPEDVPGDETVRLLIELTLEEEPQRALPPQFDLGVVDRYFSHYDGDRRLRPRISEKLAAQRA
jgi:hypothetical protein